MVGLRWALRRLLGQQGSLNSSQGISKSQETTLTWQTLSREYSSAGRGIGVWGACFDGGQPHQGTGEAPGLLREAGLLKRLKEGGHSVTDHGDLAGPRGGPEEVLEFSKRTAERVKAILDQGQVAVTLGGDHSIGLGTLAGSLQHNPDTVVLWVDAHADINTPSSSTSGNMHGMPVSFHLPSLSSDLTPWIDPVLSPQRIAYLGLRDVDPPEQAVLESLGIASYYVQDMDRLGVSNALGEALSRIDPEGKRPIHLSFDIDVLDPSEAPATGTRVRGGLTLREGLQLAHLVHTTGRLSAVDMVEVNPRLEKSPGDAERTVEAAGSILLAALGLRRQPPF